ncbi:aminopeptidase P family protein [Spiroplasma eriocheiris]|uniref:Xaa-Pro dipeptidase n=1 Tax=Spiroplasma eriocheiris TaxID=315358 RepID=A0A0H3XKX3_9MOLU|nr:aminopeptidase P family protein [Spiroplasma eriocheiris]AHF57673.1 putative Xaa-Pro dipeptidase [Spiroplasma eriocheiris CCTCC M 207170]AKM54124.1 Xaa-Pro dipeptidase [Spiroplasma eriocheiris]
MQKFINIKLDCNAILNNYLTQHNVEGILFHSPVNRLWFSKFASSEGYLLYTKDESILFLDGRYITAGKEHAKNVTRVELMATNNANGFFGTLSKALTKHQVKSLAFESDFLVYSHYQMIDKALGDVTLKPVDFTELRAIKDNEEVNLIKKACAIGDSAIANVIKKITVGMTEREVEQIILNTFIEMGAEQPSFETIVASGIRGALPHGKASDKVINNNELVTIDFGCIYQGYCSDTTRTIGLGQPSAKMLEIYDVVYQVQKLGIAAIKPGVTTKEIDDICRNYIIEKGYGEYFTHSTGHGLGIEVHEFPRVSPFCNVPLKPGMVITVEPGIYIPDLGGVRIEDDILVTEDGHQLLTEAQRELVLV